MKKVIRDGKVAVLFSPDYGAGWFSWNLDHPECVFEPEIVELVENNKLNDIDSLATKLYGKQFYSGGASSLKIRWLDEGTQFRINEYDGSESIEIYSGERYFIA